MIPTERTAATVAFTPLSDTPQEITIRLRPAGGEWGQENLIEVVSAKVVSPAGQEAQIQDGLVCLTPQSNERVVIEIETSDALDDFAFRIG